MEEQWQKKPHVQPLDPIPPPAFNEQKIGADLDAAIDAISLEDMSTISSSAASEVIPCPNWMNHYPERCRRHYAKCMTQGPSQHHPKTADTVAYSLGEAGRAGVYSRSTGKLHLMDLQNRQIKHSKQCLSECHTTRGKKSFGNTKDFRSSLSRQSSQESLVTWTTSRERPNTVHGFASGQSSNGFDAGISAFSAPLFLKAPKKQKSRLSSRRSVGLSTPAMSPMRSPEATGRRRSILTEDETQSLKSWAEKEKNTSETALKNIDRSHSTIQSNFSSLDTFDDQSAMKTIASNYSTAGTQISKAVISSKVKAEVARKWEDQLLPTHKTVASGVMRAGAVPFRLSSQLTRERQNDVFGKKKIPSNTTSDVPRMLYFHERQPMQEQNYRNSVHNRAALHKQRKGMRPVRTSKACNRILVVYHNGRTDIVLQEEINKISSKASMPGGLKIQKILPIL
mmetsp:Transcript_38182/g.50300  ORF Transcript_38182/g.50300 Transcript_38182/m.50300 type:complete len:453 (-) Transcript_38182:95-1453(-)